MSCRDTRPARGFALVVDAAAIMPAMSAIPDNLWHVLPFWLAVGSTETQGVEQSSFQTGNTLYTNCATNIDFCSGYVAGVADAWSYAMSLVQVGHSTTSAHSKGLI
jgi:hypothetical protein